MAKDFIYKINQGQALPASDPNGYRVLLDQNGQFKLLGSDGSVASLQVESSGSELTETIVNISSAQILSAGTQPIELLPAPGADKYYELKLILEYTRGTVDYQLTGNNLLYVYGLEKTLQNLLTNSSPKSWVVTDNADSYQDITSNYIVQQYRIDSHLNAPITLSTFDGNNPTNGDGTLKAKITYTIKTFG